MALKTIPIELTEADIARFWLCVDRRREDECWSWKLSLAGSGYGSFPVRSGGHQRCYTACRVAWFLSNGRQPEALVCHRCDNPACCNPAHLFSGTQFDNMRDMVAKGRNWQSKVTHCPKDHPYSAENTRIDLLGRRHCRICGRAASNRWYAATRSTAARSECAPTLDARKRMWG